MKARADDWPFLPEVHLFHDEDKCRKFVRKLLGREPEFHGMGRRHGTAMTRPWC